jgi:ribosomal protein L30E
MDEIQTYIQEDSPVNEMKGFTKNFQKRSKEKKVEDKEILDLLSHVKQGNVTYGTKVTLKNFKKNRVEKVYISSNCDDRSANLVKYYAKLVNKDAITLKINSDEISQKLSKPYLISMVCVVSEVKK